MASIWRDTAEAFLAAAEGAADGFVKARRKAAGGLVDEKPQNNTKGGGLAGIFTDPELELFSPGGAGGGQYAQRPTGMSYDVLRRMSSAPPIAAVGNTMCDGLAEFCTPQPNHHQPGFAVRMRGKGRTHQPTRVELKEIERIQKFLLHCGDYADASELVNRPDLEDLVRAAWWDSFRFDGFCVQVEPKLGWAPGGKFVPHRFYAWPGHTMRLAMPPHGGERLRDDDLVTPRYVQVDRHDQVVAEYTAQQMMYGVLHPLTDIENAGYGYSILEQLVDVLSAWLYGYGYNKSYFRQGANVRGVLHFEQEPPREQQRRFERYFHALITGVGNAHKVPIAWGGKASWLGLGQTNREMEFTGWMDFLTKLLCAIAGMDPAEINFTYGNTGQTAAMGSASTVEKVQTSRNRWLRPRVRSLFKWLNKGIVWPINPDMEAVPTGIDIESEEAEHKRRMDAVQHTHTVDEVRAEMGLPPLPNGEGCVILNTTWLQAKQGAQQAPDDGEQAPPGDAADGSEDGDDGEAEASAQPTDDDVQAATARLFGARPTDKGREIAKSRDPGLALTGGGRARLRARLLL